MYTCQELIAPCVASAWTGCWFTAPTRIASAIERLAGSGAWSRRALNASPELLLSFQGEVWSLAQPLCRVARRSDAAYIGAMLIQRLVLLATLCALASPALVQPDPAADYPNHPVRIIASTSAGGGGDPGTRLTRRGPQRKVS